MANGLVSPLRMYNDPMGAFKTRVQIATRQGENAREIEALVDTGAAYSMLPESILREIGVTPTGSQAIEYADGRVDSRPIGWAEARIDDQSGGILVIFGPDSMTPLFGAHSLQSLRLMVDSPNERLVPLPTASV